MASQTASSAGRAIRLPDAERAAAGEQFLRRQRAVQSGVGGGDEYQRLAGGQPRQHRHPLAHELHVRRCLLEKQRFKRWAQDDSHLAVTPEQHDHIRVERFRAFLAGRQNKLHARMIGLAPRRQQRGDGQTFPRAAHAAQPLSLCSARETFAQRRQRLGVSQGLNEIKKHRS